MQDAQGYVARCTSSFCLVVWSARTSEPKNKKVKVNHGMKMKKSNNNNSPESNTQKSAKFP
jgi:hypothetical protein